MSKARDLADGTFDTDTLVVDAGNNRVGIGTSSPSGKLQVETSGTAANLYVKSDISTSALASRISLGNSTSDARFTFGLLGGGGETAYLGSEGSFPLYFQTNGTERLRILPSGGITFNGDTATANALNDYEEGDFSPTWQQGITSPTLGAAEGYYTKVGNLVTFCMLIYANSGTANSSHMYIGGLPYTSSSIITPSGVILSYQNGFKTNLDLSFHIPRSATVIHLYTQSTGNPFYGVDATNVLKYLYLNGFYYTA